MTTVNTSATLLATGTAPCTFLVENQGPLAIQIAANSGMTGAETVQVGATGSINVPASLSSSSNSVSVYATVASGTATATTSVLPLFQPGGGVPGVTMPFGDDSAASATDQFVQEAVANAVAEAEVINPKTLGYGA